MHAWANAADWFWMALMMLVWIVLIALVGYAAIMAALRPPHPNLDGSRRVKNA